MNSQFSREGGYQPWTSDIAVGRLTRVRVVVGSMELGWSVRRPKHKLTAPRAIPMTWTSPMYPDAAALSGMLVCDLIGTVP